MQLSVCVGHQFGHSGQKTHWLLNWTRHSNQRETMLSVSMLLFILKLLNISLRWAFPLKEVLAYSGGPAAVSLHCSVMWLDVSPNHSCLFAEQLLLCFIGCDQPYSCSRTHSTSLRSVAARPKTLQKEMWWVSVLRLISVSKAEWLDI